MYDRCVEWWVDLYNSGAVFSGRTGPSIYWGAHQRVLQAAVRRVQGGPTVELVRAALAEGRSVVIGLLSTSESNLVKADKEDALDDFKGLVKVAENCVNALLKMRKPATAAAAAKAADADDEGGGGDAPMEDAPERVGNNTQWRILKEGGGLPDPATGAKDLAAVESAKKTLDMGAASPVADEDFDGGDGAGGGGGAARAAEDSDASSDAEGPGGGARVAAAAAARRRRRPVAARRAARRAGRRLRRPRRRRRDDGPQQSTPDDRWQDGAGGEGRQHGREERVPLR